MNFVIPLQMCEVKKYIFKLKPIRRNGLLLNISHRKDKKRFIHCCFHHVWRILALSDKSGRYYFIDFRECKFWTLTSLDLGACTIIRFSLYKTSEILCGGTNGNIYVINFETGNVTGRLIGHRYPIKNLSFTQNRFCLSGSQFEAIIWDLETNTKIHELRLEKGCCLQEVAYIPVTNNVLACFQDGVIQIWETSTFESIKQFLPSFWNNFSVRSIAISRNGKVITIAGYLPVLAVFDLDDWKLVKVVSLPEYVRTIKSIQFVPQNFDGGYNKTLAVLSGQGALYFYDMYQNDIFSELTSYFEIIKIDCDSSGLYIACTLCSGEVEVYELNQYVSPQSFDLRSCKMVKKTYRKTKLKNSNEIISTEYKVNSVLTFAKLNPILKEFGEYPEKYRRKIWEKILQLPNNIEQYNNIINHITVMAFEDLYFKYPLENIGTIKCLRKLLNNVVNWCPFIVHIDYLPMFAFPFVKVFENTPVACFEAICTILLNWCQHWFDYFPLPPMNILIIIENMLVEHDPELFYHFQYFNITTELYGWTLLETAFTEVLTASEWLILWDHILTNKEDPSFFLCATVSYNFVHKNILKSLKTLEEFEFFYHNQNPNDMKTFLNKTYYIMKNTSAKVYPGQYYRPFKYIENGKYPLFENYPKTMCNLYIAKDLFSTLIDFDKYGTLFFEKARRKWKRANLFRKRREEIRRQIELIDDLKNAQNKNKEDI